MGSALMGPLHFYAFSQRDFLGTPVNLLMSSPGRTFFPNLSKFLDHFAAAPLVLTPFVRNQEQQEMSEKSQVRPRVHPGEPADRHVSEDRAELRRAGGEIAAGLRRLEVLTCFAGIQRSA